MRKISLYFVNVILFVLCSVVIAVYMAFPIVQVKVELDMDADFVQDLLDEYGDSLGDYGDIDVKSALGDNVYAVSLTVAIKSDTLINALVTNDTMDFATTTISSTLDYFIDDITDVLVVVVKSVATTQVTSIAKDYLTTYLNDNSTSELSSDEVQQLLDDAGITDEYINEQLDTIMSVLETEGSTTQDVTDAVMDVVEDLYSTASSSGVDEFANLELDDDTKEEIRKEVEDAINEIADEDGNVSMDTLLAKALEYLNGSTSSEGEGAVSGATTVSSVRVVEDNTAAEETSDVKTQINEALTDIIAGYLTDDVLEIINIAVIVLAALLLFSCFTWLYVIIKMLFKVFCKNPGVKFKLPVILGWLPFLLFMAAPYIALAILPSFVAMPEILSSLTFSFWSSGLIALIAAVILIIIWIPYGTIRKRLKKQIKAEKKAAKAA